MISRYKLIVALIAVLMPISAAAADPCSKAKELWKERQLLDINMQGERIAKRRQIIKAMADADVFTQQLIDVKKKIVAAEPNSREDLWKQSDAISVLRDEANEVVSRYSDEYSKLSSDRRENIHRLREREFSARLECALNKPLGDKLSALAKDVAKNSKLSADKKAYVLSLIEERQKLIDAIDAEMKAKVEAMESLKRGMAKDDAELEAISSKEAALSDARDKKLDESSELLSKSNDALGDYGDKISEISEKILAEIK